MSDEMLIVCDETVWNQVGLFINLIWAIRIVYYVLYKCR
jgi:hypothetical protein